ncbi:EamA-like transporter family protein [compost metagenome]
MLLAPFAGLDVLPSTANAWLLLATLGLVHTGLMSSLLYSAIQKIPTSLVGALSFIYPLVAIIVDWAVFGHRLSMMQLLGAAAILLAAAGMNFGWRLMRAKKKPCLTDESQTP